MNIENGASSVQIPPEKPESRKVYPFSMRKLKEQAKKICNKNGRDFKLGMVLASFLEYSTIISSKIGFVNPTWSM